MIVRGTEYRPMCGAAGVQGFVGEEYPHHRYLRRMGLDLTGMGFSAKTVVLNPRTGNMPLREDGITPKEFTPECILPNLKMKNLLLSLKMIRGGYMLNAVSLSCPGLDFILNTGKWQEREEPFRISFMAVAPTFKERMLETRSFAKKLGKELPFFKSKVLLQVNVSCANVGLDLHMLIYEVETMLGIPAAELDVPIEVKVNVLMPIEAAKAIAEDPNCDALCVSNAIKFGAMQDKINWKKLFGSDISPLAKFGGGALSGPPIFPHVRKWVRDAREAGIKKPINAGGGISRASDVDLLKSDGASGEFIGTIVNMRPRRVQGIIQRAYQIF